MWRPISSPEDPGSFPRPVMSIGKGSYVHCRNVTGRGGQSMAACASDPRSSRASSMHTDRPGPDRIRANLPGNCRTRSYTRGTDGLPCRNRMPCFRSLCSRPGSDMQHPMPVAQKLRSRSRATGLNSARMAGNLACCSSRRNSFHLLRSGRARRAADGLFCLLANIFTIAADQRYISIRAMK